MNNLNDFVLSGNVITDLSGHFSQFCIMHSTLTKNRLHCYKVRDYAKMRLYYNDILQINALALLAQVGNEDPNNQFSTFYNRLNKLVNKQKRESKQLKKPRITKGTEK